MFCFSIYANICIYFNFIKFYNNYFICFCYLTVILAHKSFLLIRELSWVRKGVALVVFTQLNYYFYQVYKSLYISKVCAFVWKNGSYIRPNT